MKVLFLITLIVVSLQQFVQTSQIQWKFDSEDSDAYLDRIHRFTKSVIIWRIDKYSRSSNLSKADLAHVIRTATDTWADAIPVDFRQSLNPSEEIDISIRFLDRDYDDISYRHFAVGELARCSYRRPIRISFNGMVKFVIGNADNDTNKDLFTVALHELGHALGLKGHSSVPDSLMAGRYSGRFTELPGDVVREIQTLYGVRIGERPVQYSQCPYHPSPPPSTSTALSTHASRQYCTPGRYYCGWHLKDMGYPVQTSYFGRIYLCENNRKGIYFTHCPNGECIGSGSVIAKTFVAYCVCPVGWKLCGYIIERWFNITVSNWHALYECESTGTSVRLINTCPDVCSFNNCASGRGNCKKNNLNCGLNMLDRRLASSSQKLDLDALYYCNNTHVPVERCHGRCMENNEEGDAFCQPETLYCR